MKCILRLSIKKTLPVFFILLLPMTSALFTEESTADKSESATNHHDKQIKSLDYPASVPIDPELMSGRQLKTKTGYLFAGCFDPDLQGLTTLFYCKVGVGYGFHQYLNGFLNITMSEPYGFKFGGVIKVGFPVLPLVWIQSSIGGDYLTGIENIFGSMYQAISVGNDRYYGTLGAGVKYRTSKTIDQEDLILSFFGFTGFGNNWGLTLNVMWSPYGYLGSYNRITLLGQNDYAHVLIAPGVKGFGNNFSAEMYLPFYITRNNYDFGLYLVDLLVFSLYNPHISFSYHF